MIGCISGATIGKSETDIDILTLFLSLTATAYVMLSIISYAFVFTSYSNSFITSICSNRQNNSTLQGYVLTNLQINE